MKIDLSKVFVSQKFVCLLFLLFGGLLSSVLQYEIVWDFINYHYYNGWAFVNGRYNQDVLMAGLNGFFNPLPDVPLYLMVKYFNDYPDLICFMQGLWFGALMYVVYRLELLFFDVSSWQGKIGAVACFAIALTGNATFLQIGTSSNEIALAFFYLLAFYWLIEEIFFRKTGNKLPFICAGFLLGAAMGLKLTGVIYCIVSGASLILFYKKIKNPWQNIAWFTLFGFLGFMAFAGFWMWKLWQEFQNPFFPFGNFIFKSDWMPEKSFFDQNFRPQNWKEFLIWPLITSFTLRRDEGDDMFVSDFRAMFVYLIAVAWGCKVLWTLVRRKKSVFEDKWAFLYCYAFLAYVIWAYFFSISRYFVVGEIVFAFIIVKALWGKNPKSFIAAGLYYGFLLLVMFVLLSTPYFSEKWGTRGNWKYLHLPQDKFVAVEDVHIPDNALIQTYNYPSSALFVYFAEKNPTISGVNVYQQVYRATYFDKIFNMDYFDFNEHWKKLRQEALARHKGPKLVLATNARYVPGAPLTLDFSKIKEIKGMECYFLFNNMLPFISLCAPKEIADEVFVHSKMKIYEDGDEK